MVTIKINKLGLSCAMLSANFWLQLVHIKLSSAYAPFKLSQAMYNGNQLPLMSQYQPIIVSFGFIAISASRSSVDVLALFLLSPSTKPPSPSTYHWKKVSKLTFFSHHLEILCWTFLNHLLILNDCVDHTTITEVDTKNEINTILKFSGQILKFVLILWFFPHYMENLCITFLQH